MNDDPQTWVAWIRHFMPQTLVERAIQQYTKDLSIQHIQRIQNILNEVERRYVEKVLPTKMEVDWDGSFKAIGQYEADRRNNEDEKFKLIQAIRYEFGLIDGRGQEIVREKNGLDK